MILLKVNKWYPTEWVILLISLGILEEEFLTEKNFVLKIRFSQQER